MYYVITRKNCCVYKTSDKVQAEKQANVLSRQLGTVLRVVSQIPRHSMTCIGA